MSVSVTTVRTEPSSKAPTATLKGKNAVNYGVQMLELVLQFNFSSNNHCNQPPSLQLLNLFFLNDLDDIFTLVDQKQLVPDFTQKRLVYGSTHFYRAASG